jgi:hypothetical protein
MEPDERVKRPLEGGAGLEDVDATTTKSFDQVADRAEAGRCLGKLDIGALAA